MAHGLQVFVAVPTMRLAGRIADVLLTRRLCACAQILGPVQSRYLWKGRRETAREFWLVLKTEESRFRELERTVRALHPYELPEIVGVPMRPVSAAYLRWITQSTRSPLRRARTPARK
jgi:periplasmic divalent cation tolerance protein